MIIYRITPAPHAADIHGTGAALFPGRWNKKGIPVLYTAESRELALLETLVHIPPLIIPELEILTLEIPDDSIAQLNKEDLPANWSEYPAPVSLAEIGNNWVKEGKTIALKVPSCIIHSSSNYILNCQHTQYDTVKVISHNGFYLDLRLVRTARES
jgi:RES domain-containing protein